MCVLGDVGYEMHEDADAEYGVHVPSVSCLPARLSFLSKPDTEFGPKQKRRGAAQQVTRAKARQRDAVESAAWTSHHGAVTADRRGRVKQPRPESVQVNRSVRWSWKETTCSQSALGPGRL